METKELLKALDLPEDIDTPEKAVTAHNSKFVSLSEAHNDDRVVEKVTGKIYGPLNSNLKKAFGLTNEDMKGKNFEEVLSLGVGNFTTKIKELSTNTGDEKIAAITKERDTFKTQAEQYKTDLEKTVGEKTALETDFNGKIKQFKVDSILKDVKGKLAFADGIPEVAKLGFNALLNEKYVFDLDDKENPVVTDKKGKKIPNPTKTGTYLTVEEVLDQELDTAGLKKKNNLNGNKPFQFGNQNNNGHTQTEPVSKVHPKAQKQMEKVNAHQ